MDNKLKAKERIVIAQLQVDNLLKLVEKLDYTQYLKNHLNPVKYELERQLKLLDNERSLD